MLTHGQGIGDQRSGRLSLALILTPQPFKHAPPPLWCGKGGKAWISAGKVPRLRQAHLIGRPIPHRFKEQFTHVGPRQDLIQSRINQKGGALTNPQFS